MPETRAPALGDRVYAIAAFAATLEARKRDFFASMSQRTNLTHSCPESIYRAAKKLYRFT